MRYDTKVKFFLGDPNAEKYDPKTGRMEKGPSQSVTKHCSVYDGGAEWAVQIFGRAETQGLVFHHLGDPIKARFVEANGKLYRIIRTRMLWRKTAYLVSELKNEI